MPLFVGSIPDMHARQGAFDYGNVHGAMDALANRLIPATATLEISTEMHAKHAAMLVRVGPLPEAQQAFTAHGGRPEARFTRAGQPLFCTGPRA